MLTLTAPQRRLSPEFLDTVSGFSGGFSWWYVDLRNDDGDGVVFIAGFGLPFLPPRSGSSSSTASMAAPRERPCVNLAVYRGGKQIWYALQELDEDACDVAGSDDDDEVYGFGASVVRVARNSGRIDVSVDVDIDVVGVARATGRIEVSGAARSDDTIAVAVDGAVESAVDHDWSPQTGVADGRASLVLDGVSFDVVGRGYHDRNGARRSLTDLGIERWAWGRFSSANDEKIVYALRSTTGEDQVIGLTIDRDGRTTHHAGLRLIVTKQRRSVFGVDVAHGVEVVADDGSVFVGFSVDSVVERGPFYVRSFVRHAGGHGVFEQVWPGRIGLARHAPLVEMRVARRASSSMWLPLFCGHASSRLARLWSFWRARARRAPTLTAGEAR